MHLGVRTAGRPTLTISINTTYGVFTSYFLQYNYYGATQLQYAFTGGLSAAMAVLQGPLANWMTRKFGYKVPLFVGAVLVALGQCLSGISKSFGAFIATQAVVFGVGMGLILVPSVSAGLHVLQLTLSNLSSHTGLTAGSRSLRASRRQARVSVHSYLRTQPRCYCIRSA